MSEAGSCLVTSPDKPCAAFVLRVLTAGVPGGRAPALAPQTLGDDRPSGLRGLFTSSAYLFTEDLYPPTPSRVNFAQWEHPEVTSC